MANTWTDPNSYNGKGPNIDNDPRWNEYGIRKGNFGKDMQRGLGLSLWPGADAQAKFASLLEPGRQSAFLNYINFLQPGSEWARTDRGAQGILNQGVGIGNQAANAATAQGLGPEYALAVRNAQLARAQRDANSFRAGIGDRMGQGYEQLIAAMRAGQEIPLVQSLIPMLFAEKVGQVPKQEDNTLGMLAGMAGTILGGPAGAALFK